MRSSWIMTLPLIVLLSPMATPTFAASIQSLCQVASYLDLRGYYRAIRAPIAPNQIPHQTLSQITEFRPIAESWAFQRLIFRGDLRALYPLFIVTQSEDPTEIFRAIYQTLKLYFSGGLAMLASDISGRDAHGNIVVRPALIRNPHIQLGDQEEKFLALSQSNPLLYIALYGTLAKPHSHVMLSEATLTVPVQYGGILMQTRVIFLPIILNMHMGGESFLLRNRWNPSHAPSLQHLLAYMFLFTLTGEEFLSLVSLHNHYRDTTQHYAEFKKLVHEIFDDDLDALDDPGIFFIRLVQIASVLPMKEASTYFTQAGFPDIQTFLNAVFFVPTMETPSP